MKKRRQLKKYYPPLKSTCRLQTCPNTQAICDGQQFSHQLERVEESVDKIRGRHRRKQAGTTGKSLNIVVSYWRGCHESLRCLRMGRN